MSSLRRVLILACIALMPFINKPFWEHYYPHISIGLGLLVAAIYVTQLGHEGSHRVLETAIDYYEHAWESAVGALTPPRGHGL